ncbi:Lrp/AsnC family transcriptional regulator [Tropicimonas marinistellae]|uniref:Lrp/AsnC family transcriptional regulator n=1 Tax=Tropicimonas marinistellae TaxID=1739787 RepID=UPI0008308E68|nr:AsnC family transcriptional regulator [Tropicimonas marinistellae]
MDTLDDFDRKLLELLSIDSRQTGQQLSGKVRLSAAACLRRVQRLRKIGAIEREAAIVSPRAAGPSVTLQAML